MPDDEDLIGRVTRLEGQVRVLAESTRKWEVTHERLVTLSDDLIEQSIALARRDDPISRQRSRDYVAIARCLIATLSGREEPLSYYLTPEA